MDIVLSTDSRYLTPAKVTIASVCKNNANMDISFHIITNPASRAEVNSLIPFAKSFGKDLTIYTIREELLNSIKFEKANRPIYFSIATYYRLFLCRLLPKDIHKVIYMDCDVLCNGSLDELWNTDMTGCSIRGVSDMYESDISFYNRLHYYPSEGYFNAGVLLINLDYWRENDCESIFLKFVAEYPERIFHHDQDILNYTLRTSKGRLPLKYNVQDGYLYQEIHFLVWPFEDEFEEAITKPVLIHYTGRFKPWAKECNHPWKNGYLKMAESIGLTISDFPEIRPDRANIYQKIRSFLVKLKIIPSTLLFRTDLPDIAI